MEKTMKKSNKGLPQNVYSCHVSPLPVNITKNEFAKFFENYEDVCDLFICHRKENPKRHTFGFVRFKSKESADHAVEFLKIQLNDWNIVVNHCKNSLKETKELKDNKDLVLKSTLDEKSTFLNKKLFEEFWESWEQFEVKEDLNEIMDRISCTTEHIYKHQSPLTAFSSDLTDIIQLDHKLWKIYYKTQEELSKSLMKM